MKLFFDTETTGKWDFKKLPTDPSQPRLVQLAAVLTTDVVVPVSAVKLLVRPDGWELSEEVSKIHGITTEFATLHGLPVKAAVSMFVNMARRATSVHAYNLDFDRMIMSGEILRIENMPQVFGRPDVGEVCEMKAMVPICKLPNKNGFKDYAWPKLSEAFQFCFGADAANQHDAMGDVESMMAIHKWRLEHP